MRILSLNQHLIGFYDGRTPQRGHQVESSWVEDGALSLGICSYALVDGADALVVDTGVSVGWAIWRSSCCGSTSTATMPR